MRRGWPCASSWGAAVGWLASAWSRRSCRWRCCSGRSPRCWSPCCRSSCPSTSSFVWIRGCCWVYARSWLRRTGSCVCLSPDSWSESDGDQDWGDVLMSEWMTWAQRMTRGQGEWRLQTFEDDDIPWSGSSDASQIQTWFHLDTKNLKLRIRSVGSTYDKLCSRRWCCWCTLLSPAEDVPLGSVSPALTGLGSGVLCRRVCRSASSGHWAGGRSCSFPGVSRTQSQSPSCDHTEIFKILIKYFIIQSTSPVWPRAPDVFCACCWCALSTCPAATNRN